MSDEPDFPDEPYRGTQILWGRVVVLFLSLALAFWLGTTFGGDASAQRRLEEQRDEITRLESQVGALEAEVAAVDAGTAASEASSEGPEEAPSARPSERSQQDKDEDGDQHKGEESDEQRRRPDEEESADADRDATEYVVQSGDSLAAIAQDVYGDAMLWREIAQANGLDEPYALSVGETLEIPDQN